MAQLFGQDFASRFCLGPLLLPHEIRDCSVPRGVPTVKMRRRSNTGNSLLDPAVGSAPTSSVATAVESIVPLTPVMPKYPSLPCCAVSNFSPHPHPPHPMLHFQNHSSPLATPMGWSPSASCFFTPGVVLPPPIPFPVQLQWAEDGRMRMLPFHRPIPGEFYEQIGSGTKKGTCWRGEAKGAEGERNGRAGEISGIPCISKIDSILGHPLQQIN